MMANAFKTKESSNKKNYGWIVLFFFLLFVLVTLLIFMFIKQNIYENAVSEYERRITELEETLDFCYETERQLMFEFDLDIEYREVIHDETLCNAELGNKVTSLGNDWRTLGEKLYSILLESEVDESFKTELEKAQNEWEVYIKNNIETKEKCYTSFSSYGSGSTVAVCMPKYEYEVYRARTLELFDMCLNHHVLNIECDEINIYVQYNGETVFTQVRKTDNVFGGMRSIYS